VLWARISGGQRKATGHAQHDIGVVLHQCHVEAVMPAGIGCPRLACAASQPQSRRGNAASHQHALASSSRRFSCSRPGVRFQTSAAKKAKRARILLVDLET
jgi:hypothetical protein